MIEITGSLNILMPGTHVICTDSDPLTDEEIKLRGVICDGITIRTVPHYYTIRIHESEYDKYDVFLTPFFDECGYAEISFPIESIQIDIQKERGVKIKEILK